MKIAIASDHGGFEQKQQLIVYILESGHSVIDFGPATSESVDYPDYAAKVASAVANCEADRGVLVCGTGIGMAIAANKIAGIRAANVTTPEFAVLSREHNNANIIALSGRFVDLDINKQSLTAFLDTEFAKGRHSLRVDKINALEDYSAQ
jgi:ribose 5-phosphate isomerase B